MARTRTYRRLGAATLVWGTALAATGCATSHAPQTALSDAAWNVPTFIVATAEGFVVGDALGMTMLAGTDIRLADVSEPFELAD